MAKKKKIRVEMRKNRSKPPRPNDWTRGFQDHGYQEEATVNDERVRAKGDLSRKRTIIQDDTTGTEQANQEPSSMPAVGTTDCLAGRVLRVHGLHSVVEAEDGRHFRCAVRRILRTISTDERNVVTCGDRVLFRSAELGARSAEREDERSNSAPRAPSPALEGVIERVEPRHGLLTRASRQREHVLVANVDQVVIVMALVEPDLKPHLIDRYLVSAERGEITPIICLNKADLADPAPYQYLVGLYSQLGIPVLFTSARTGLGIDRLRERLKGRETVFSGQSGVGKSSLLNAVEPELALHVREVSEVNQKGKHTTTTAQLIRMSFGGWVVDTPGIRQFALWDVIPEEVEGFFAEFRPFVPLCIYPDCSHTHEDRCAVKRAVERRQISASRYRSYLGMFSGDSVD